MVGVLTGCIGRVLTVLLVFAQNEAAAIKICDDSIKPISQIIRGAFTGEPDLIATLHGTRSKVECAVKCKLEEACNTALFHTGGDCLLLRNFVSQMNISHQLNPKTEIADVIPIRVVGGLCPSSCRPPSVCMYDCSNEASLTPLCVNSTSNSDGNGSHLSPVVQAKEYYLKNLDIESSTSLFVFFTVNFQKMSSWTALKIMFRGVLRSGFGGSQKNSAIWEITFNRSSCKSPGAIQAIHYNFQTDVDHHKSTGIQGICYNLSAGAVSISLQTVNVTFDAKSMVGYASNGTRLFVEEINYAPTSTEPLENSHNSLSIFNTRQYTTARDWIENPVTTLWQVEYNKMENSTGLRINLDFAIRLFGQDKDDRCISYNIKIDDRECSPYSLWKTLAYSENSESVIDELRAVEIEGHCHGLLAGDHTLSLIVGTCSWGVSSGDALTGIPGVIQRLIIEEFNQGIATPFIISTDGFIFKIPQFNIQTTGIENPSIDLDSGPIWSLPSYNKTNALSGLRITMSSVGRCMYKGAGTEPCCRHYFVINGAECFNPGPIEGVHILSKIISFHRPIMVDGICDGIPVGAVSIVLYAGICKGHAKAGDCHFGYRSVVHVMISETLVERKIINF